MAPATRRRSGGARTAQRTTLTLRELNRATLARQMLLEPGRPGVADATRALGALQAQHPDWPAVALWSRLRDFRPGALERAFRDRRVVRASLMRLTLHVVATTDFWPMWRLASGFRRTQWRLIYKRDPADPALMRDLADAHEAAAAALRERPLNRTEIAEVMAAAAPARMRALPHHGLWRHVAATMPLVQVPERGETYGRGRYALATEWLRASPAETAAAALDEPTADDRSLLMRRYLTAFGPANLDDALAWIGRGPGGVGPWRDALAGMGDELVELVDDGGRAILDLRAAPRPDGNVPAPPRFLARWDSVLLAHAPKARTRILPAAMHGRVNRRNGDVLPTFLLDGFVAGTWEPTIDRTGATLVLRPFVPIDVAARHDLEAHGEDLIRFLRPGSAAHRVVWEES